MLDTKIAIVVRDEPGGVAEAERHRVPHERDRRGHTCLLGAPYEDAAGNTYHALAIQPMIVLAADAGTIQTIYQRTMRRGVRLSRYIDDMFRTGHDEANRATVKRARPEEMKVVGLALREDKKVVDKVTAGARMHP
jgi:hypothetical protein